MKKPALFVMALLATLPLQAHAANHANLERGQPTALEDAYPITQGGREIQSYFSYERTGRNEDRFRWTNDLVYGVVQQAQLRLHLPFVFGSDSIDNFNGFGFEGFYNFYADEMEEYLPAFSMSARIDAPVGDEMSGEDKEGWDTTLKLIASKQITQAPYHGAVHANAGWTHNFDAHAIEREDLYQVTAGYSQQVGPRTVLVTDLTREQHVVKDNLENVLEVGVRQKLSDKTIANGGFGFGVGDDSPDFRVTFGLARTF